VEAVREFLKNNSDWVKVILTIIGVVFGVQITLTQTNNVDKIEIIVNNEPDDLTVFGDFPAQQAFEGRTFSPLGLKALRVAGVRLRKDDTDTGKQLFAVLKRLHNDPASLTEVEKAVADAHIAIDPVTLSIIIKIAIKLAIAYLEVRAPNTENEWDDRLLALLKLFSTQPQTIAAAHTVAG